jgi:hypothetical protein
VKFPICVVLTCALLGSARTLSAQTASRPTPAALLGCYALTLGPWQQQYAEGPAQWQTIPGVFRLDSALLASPPGWRRLSPTTPFYSSRRGIGPAWRVGPTDSVESFWSTGFVSTGLKLGVRGDTLLGKATASTDVRGGAPDPTATARAVRVACPADTQ